MSFNIGNKMIADILEKNWGFQNTPSNLFPYEVFWGETYGNPHSAKFLPCICHRPKTNEKHMF